jgi:hypothetical protein
MAAHGAEGALSPTRHATDQQGARAAAAADVCAIAPYTSRSWQHSHMTSGLGGAFVSGLYFERHELVHQHGIGGGVSVSSTATPQETTSRRIEHEHRRRG